MRLLGITVLPPPRRSLSKGTRIVLIRPSGWQLQRAHGTTLAGIHYRVAGGPPFQVARPPRRCPSRRSRSPRSMCPRPPDCVSTGTPRSGSSRGTAGGSWATVMLGVVSESESVQLPRSPAPARPAARLVPTHGPTRRSISAIMPLHASLLKPTRPALSYPTRRSMRSGGWRAQVYRWRRHCHRVPQRDLSRRHPTAYTLRPRLSRAALPLCPSAAAGLGHAPAGPPFPMSEARPRRGEARASASRLGPAARYLAPRGWGNPEHARPAARTRRTSRAGGCSAGAGSPRTGVGTDLRCLAGDVVCSLVGGLETRSPRVI